MTASSRSMVLATPIFKTGRRKLHVSPTMLALYQIVIVKYNLQQEENCAMVSASRAEAFLDLPTGFSGKNKAQLFEAQAQNA